ncbi:hypothetical protein ALI22I_14675 [Saccharothrix sp. ALI-22-I]|uniref:hypothetical protein n=1 Tax=Saccharothrix sp. ALI-22-I TaxID=1933778 RepID=UPI00097C56D1|nr:hypothetical protein [Saccharothrix sp. ALI-22-I]ONI89733.1 hypothetical protein ALI22I_14675 [Saccharothrix sp. ALI-22-I]
MNASASHIAELHAQVTAHAEPPVVVVDRPFAILAVLIGSVAGFVFRGPASMLCHLSIVLREHGVPAVSVPDFEVEQGRVLNLLGNGEVRVEVPRA